MPLKGAGIMLRFILNVYLLKVDHILLPEFYFANLFPLTNWYKRVKKNNQRKSSDIETQTCQLL